ncbi:hypothetical protein, partial [Brevibacillus sp. SKDU10]|uniref:hypothetical protein n=1 Tax=Brevibacillus sp. SKDU10 TaxID=1247872 RepID=UPI000AA3CE8D
PVALVIIAIPMIPAISAVVLNPALVKHALRSSPSSLSKKAGLTINRAAFFVFDSYMEHSFSK